MSRTVDERRASNIIHAMEMMLEDKTRQSFGHGCLFRGDVRALVNTFRRLQKDTAGDTRGKATSKSETP